MSIEFDFSELNELAVKIEGAGTRVRQNAKKAVETAAFRGKKLWQAKAAGHRFLPGYPASIEYEVEGVGAGNRSGEIEAVIGPLPGKAQGSLAIVEESPGGVRGKPQRNREKILPKIQEDLTKGILIAVGDGMGGV